MLDLRHVKCPLNFVKAKLAAEKLLAGQALHIVLSPDVMMNVPQSLEQEGYVVAILSTSLDGMNLMVTKPSG
jgi:TusA-related sulfurtransferase